MSWLARAYACILAGAVFLQAVPAAASSSTFARAGDDAVTTLLGVYYAGEGAWRECNDPGCRRADSDWGVDSATYALYLRWKTAQDPVLGHTAGELLANAPRYAGDPCQAAPCPAWSDTPAWDAVAFMREGRMEGDLRGGVARAEAALRYVSRSAAFVGGACPDIPFQHPQPSTSPVKTLETDANAIKAALLIYGVTRDVRYLDQARSRYAADRRAFLDPDTPLYTVHVIDDGTSCVQQPHRFFASVNGDMIWNGLRLWRITGDQHFYDEAVATARAVDSTLSDDRGIFVDLAGDNDVVEPLVEAMDDLAVDDHLAFARAWILRNAAAALSARGPDGTFSRFFDGPPQSTTSIWETNGGLALEIAAASLDPDGDASVADGWQTGVPPDGWLTELPATITFDGSGIALVGTIGRRCETSHLRIVIDGVATFDRTGLWQNHGMPTGAGVHFAWRWPSSGEHTIRLEAGAADLGPNAIRLQTIVLPGADTVAVSDAKASATRP